MSCAHPDVACFAVPQLISVAWYVMRTSIYIYIWQNYCILIDREECHFNVIQCRKDVIQCRKMKCNFCNFTVLAFWQMTVRCYNIDNWVNELFSTWCKRVTKFCIISSCILFVMNSMIFRAIVEKTCTRRFFKNLKICYFEVFEKLTCIGYF